LKYILPPLLLTRTYKVPVLHTMSQAFTLPSLQREITEEWIRTIVPYPPSPTHTPPRFTILSSAPQIPLPIPLPIPFDFGQYDASQYDTPTAFRAQGVFENFGANADADADADADTDTDTDTDMPELTHDFPMRPPQLRRTVGYYRDTPQCPMTPCHLPPHIEFSNTLQRAIHFNDLPSTPTNSYNSLHLWQGPPICLD
jgi:hypothetical protein